MPNIPNHLQDALVLLIQFSLTDYLAITLSKIEAKIPLFINIDKVFLTKILSKVRN